MAVMHFLPVERLVLPVTLRLARLRLLLDGRDKFLDLDHPDAFGYFQLSERKEFEVADA